MAPALPSMAIIQRQQNLRRLPSVQRPYWQQIQQSPEEIDQDQELVSNLREIPAVVSGPRTCAIFIERRRTMCRPTIDPAA